MYPSVLRFPFAVRPTLFLLALGLTACVAEQETVPQSAVADTGLSPDQAAPDGGLFRPDAADAATSVTPTADQTSELTTLAEFRGAVDVAAGTMRLEVLEGDAVTDAGLRRAQQGLCTLAIVQDGVPGSGPANSLELVTGTTGLDGACEGFLASPLFCGAVTVRSFYTSPQTQLFAQIQSLVPSTGFGVQNGDLVPGASSGLGSWAYGDLGAASSAPANAGVRNWVFARSGGNFTFTGRVVANVTELCDGLDNDCDGATDEGIGCRTQGQNCAATADCSGTLVCTASVCSLASCPSGEHAESGACVSDTRSCSAPIASAATQTWTGSEYGPCVPTVCAASYHVESGACTSDTRSCTLPNATAAAESWNSTTSTYGACTATTCASGYWLNAGVCVLQSTLGTACTLDAECASGNCATGPDGTANDRCAPTDMNYIPAGTFTMGSPSGEIGQDTDETQHSVTISRSFFMGQTEVTQGQWKALSGGINPSHFQSTTGPYPSTANDNDTAPVERVRWYAAVAFANARSAAEGLTSCYSLTGCADEANGWKDGAHSGCTGATFAGLTCTGYRLPTEAEWEYAARAGTTTATYGGNLSAISGCVTLSGTGGFAAGTALSSLAWYDCNAGSRTQAVGGKTANSFGLSDMLGNVWEWTGDWYGTYPGTVTDPTGATTGSRRVYRGGSWNGYSLFERAAARYFSSPGDRSSDLGFRLSRTVTRGCTTLPLNATEGVEAGNASGWGACEATACSASYHVESGACVSDCGDGQLQAAEVCDDGNTSDADSCNNNCTCGTGYHVEGGACVSDTRSCTLPNATVASELWNGAAYGPCTASACASGYWLNAGVCVLQSTLGAACTANIECASGFCATGPDGTANDRCAPEAMNYIPAGTFTMGSPSEEVGRGWNETQHSVTISRSFFLGQTEVTQGQWKALSGGVNPSCFQSTTSGAYECTPSNANDSGPLEQLDWYSAVAFANARSAAEGLTSCYTLTGCTDAANGWQDGLHSGCTGATLSSLACTGYRLPTESEWEYAARAGTSTATYGGNLSAEGGCVTLSGTGGFAAGTAFGSLAWYDCNAGSRTQAVGGKTANSFGLSDMLGNVWEWTGDWYGTYPATVTDPTGATTGPFRVNRGGSFASNARYARAALRNIFAPDFREIDLGFRLSRTVTRGCTTLPLNATEGVEAGNASGWGACEATACSASYHVESGACVSDTRSCTLPNATAAAESWNSGTSSYGSCTASACASSYTVVAGACIGSLGAACTLNAECASGFCATGPDGTANDRCAPIGMHYIPAGTFTMGSPSGEVGQGTDETQHSVTISRSFFMGQTEVTQAQWKALSGGANPSYFQTTTCTYIGGCASNENANDSGPVENLDWYAAVAFANARSAAEGLTSCYTLTGCADATNGWKDGIHSGCTGATFVGLNCTGYRLPTESEWEYAARAGTTAATYAGNLSGTVSNCTTAQAALDGIAWWCNNGSARTHAGGGKSANSFGLYDMLGNVIEWTGDWYITYPATVTDPTGPTTGAFRVARGGSWYDIARGVRAAARDYGAPGDRISFLGFRLSRTVP